MDVYFFRPKVKTGRVNGNKKFEIKGEAIMCVEPHIMNDIWNDIV